MKKSTVKNTFYCIKYIWAISPKYILLMIGVSVLTSAFNIINLVILRYITNTLMLDTINLFAMGLIIMFLISCTIAFINGSINYLIEPILQNCVVEKVQGDIYTKAQKFDFEAFEDKDFYDLYFFVAQNGKEAIIKSVTLTTSLLTSLLSIIGISSIILGYDVTIILISVIGVVMSCICTMKMKQMQYEYNINIIPINRDIDYIHRIFYINDYIKEILSFPQKNVFSEKYKCAWKRMNEKTVFWGKKIRKQYLLVMFIDIIVETLILIYLGYKTISGNLILGDFIVLYTGIQKMIGEFKAAITCIPDLYSNGLNLEKYLEFMNKATPNDNKNKIETIDNIRFEHISFSYNGKVKTLQDINFELGNSIHKIAIVGQNGSGKSTLVKLLLGFYTGYSGKIMINGQELSTFDKSCYRARISLLSQDFRLFSLTVSQNINMSYYTSPMEDKKINETLEQVRMYDKIQNLPQKNKTVLSREFDGDGICLSGGEQQKIALARTIIQDSDIVILDEPFSNLDNIAMTNMLEDILKICSNKIVLIITHKLRGLSQMDAILLLEKGQIIERGKESELLAYKGKYYQMYEADHEK